MNAHTHQRHHIRLTRSWSVFLCVQDLPLKHLGLEGTPHYMAPEMLSSEVRAQQHTCNGLCSHATTTAEKVEPWCAVRRMFVSFDYQQHSCTDTRACFFVCLTVGVSRVRCVGSRYGTTFLIWVHAMLCVFASKRIASIETELRGVSMTNRFWRLLHRCNEMKCVCVLIDTYWAVSTPSGTSRF